MMMRWLTESKALEKSINRQRKYSLVSGMIDTVLVISTSAAGVLPVGLKATEVLDL